MERKLISPDYYFEVSWEVCNKVGGIYTVISTKALTLKKRLHDKHILIGPDTWRDSRENPEFIEDKNLFASWKIKAAEEGLRIRIGRWKIPGEPIVIILDFTTFMALKDEIFSKLWETFKLDSMSGQWDYIEPALFGYGAGRVIESFAKYNLSTRTKVVAQFHEWMTGAGLLYLADKVPNIATVFTTHATVIGRSIAGNRLPLYDHLNEYDGDAKSNDFNVVSKQSLEKISAWHADAFTTVSDITARECVQLLKKEVDIVTPNGFDISFVPEKDTFDKKRSEARDLLIRTAETLLGYKLPEKVKLVTTSGRYEYYNKGIDVYLDALGEINKIQGKDCRIVAFLLIPAHHYGGRKELLDALRNNVLLEGNTSCLTHNLHHPEYDPVLNKMKQAGLTNAQEGTVKIIFVPSYLNGDDGVFNKSYYDLLIGFDLTIFASYYEPWGYTPLESLAFKIPTITTKLAGFGLWVEKYITDTKNGITVVDRSDNNTESTINGIANAIRNVCSLNPEEFNEAREQAQVIARISLWDNQINYYYQAFNIALTKLLNRTNLYFDKEKPDLLSDIILNVRPEWKSFSVEENIPEKLSGLEELSRNLWWSWNHEAVELFRSIDEDMWKEASENPIVLLNNIPLDKFTELENDQAFMKKLNSILKRFRSYQQEGKVKKEPTIAYFSMEYGLHDSLRIYSGGLGILAGDYLKEASDSNLDLVGIGLLYRYGYFTQTISGSGEQIVANEPQDFARTPAQPVRDELGNWKTVTIVFPGRTLTARIWKVDVGRIELYLLDTDFEGNLEEDRRITHHLYGGDNENRFRQEILLGIGGIRALRVLGKKPDLFHCNEGHAAFIGFERLRELIDEHNLTFQEALEVVRSSSLFTTHTPVPAGHDSFDENLLRMYMSHYPSRLNISWERFIGFGRLHPGNRNERFSMSYLGINMSQDVNGVSKLHGKVTQEMFSDIWKGYNTDELHLGYVTNGVHLQTWTAKAWLDLYESIMGKDFISRQDDKESWKKIIEVPDNKIWSIRNKQRTILIDYIKERLRIASVRRRENPKYIMEAEENLRDNVLTIGFARRFATYKRAHLLFRDKDRLARIVNHPQYPVQFVFAGKAHPNDKAGQDLIRIIVDISKQPEFVGRIIFLQNYEMQLAKKLVQGVDIWLNTPTMPLEASGTSGQKAVLNGALHFSVLDGWWAEGYVEGAGWAIEDEGTYDNQDYQDELDAETIYSLLENEITKLFYERDKDGLPRGWIDFIKKSIAEIAPNFTMNRMLIDYMNKYYYKLYSRSQNIMKNEFDLAKELTAWKRIVTRLWNNVEVVSFRHPDISQHAVILGQSYETEVVLELHNLSPEDIGVELVIKNFTTRDNGNGNTYTQEFERVEMDQSRVVYRTTVTPVKPGIFDYGIRIFAWNNSLPHRQDFPLVKWV
jgi:phosphorylase/glycogen(starch) synthase